MEKPEEIETNKDEKEIEAGDLETKDRKNKNTRPRSSSKGKRFKRLKMKFGGETYDTQFATITGEKKNIYA